MVTSKQERPGHVSKVSISDQLRRNFAGTAIWSIWNFWHGRREPRRNTARWVVVESSGILQLCVCVVKLELSRLPGYLGHRYFFWTLSAPNESLAVALCLLGQSWLLRPGMNQVSAWPCGQGNVQQEDREARDGMSSFAEVYYTNSHTHTHTQSERHFVIWIQTPDHQYITILRP